MNFPKITELKTPKLGNLILQIVDDSDLKDDTIEDFKLLFSENSCIPLTDSNEDYEMCSNFWPWDFIKRIRTNNCSNGSSNRQCS